MTATATPDVRQDWPQLGLLVALGGLLFWVSRGSALPAMTLDQAAAAAPGGMVAIAVAASVHTRSVDVSLIAVHSIALAVLGRGAETSDLRVLATLGLCIVASVLGGLLASFSSTPFVVSLVLYLAYSRAASAIAGSSASISDTSQSAILGLASPAATELVLLGLVAVGAWLLLMHSNRGRLLRLTTAGAPAGGARPNQVDFTLSRVLLGLIVWLSAVVAFARLGVSGGPDAGQELMAVLGAVFVGVARTPARRATPVRVGVAYLILVAIHDQLIAAGWSSGNADIVLVAPALVVLIAETGRGGESPWSV